MMKNWIMGSVMILLGSCILIACSTSTIQQASSIMADHPQFEKMCSKCHTLDRVHAAHRAMSETQMEALVERMADKPHSGIDRDDIQSIVREMY